MLILAIHTATPALSAALWQDGRLVAGTALATGRPHAETLLPLIEDLLRQAGQPVAAIDAYACAIGPGSYTGIRIGVSAIKALAYASGKPAVGVSTLEAMAWPFVGCAGLLACPVLDARNGRIYAAAWQNGQCRVAEGNWPIAEFISRLADVASDEPRGGAGSRTTSGLIIGDLPPAAKSLLDAALLGQSALRQMGFAPEAANLPIALPIAEIAENRLLAGLAESAEALAPCYLSPSQAERLAKQQGVPNHA